jgi:subtilisin family serine protease
VKPADVAGSFPVRGAAVAVLAIHCLIPWRAASQSTSLSSEAPPEVRAEALSKLSDWVLATTVAGRETDFLVVLAPQADLSGAAALGSKEEKGRFVWNALRRTAEESQRPLRDLLEGLGIPHRPFVVVNAIAVTGRRETALALAARPEVARIEGDPLVLQRLPRPERTAFATTGAVTTTAEPGIVQSRAPDVWSLGYTGQGIVAGGQDTGYSWAHPALLGAYRGWNGSNASHDYNWHDAIHLAGSSCGADSPVPCDDDSHGTHTMGTVLGDDGAGNQIGMAPGAKWIGCRNMNGGVGSPSTYLECFQFFLAPYPVGGSPSQGDPSKAPHVTNNSWSCPSFEGCSALTLQAAVAAHRAAGIFTTASAGNSGPTCSTVSAPPAIYDEVFSVGALQTGTDNIASSSSRGPVTADGSGRAKPDIAAPGTSVRSSIPGGGYGSKSGTSMAGPHVAGAVALVWSAKPALIGQIDQTERVLADSAAPIASTDCGATSRPNYVFGWGRLDAKAAVDLALVRPILSGLSVSTGPVGGGTPVTISGANFVSGAGVTFGGTAAASVVVVSAATITAVTPAHAAGPVDVTVTNPDTKSGTLPGGFTYLPPMKFYTVPPCRVIDTRAASPFPIGYGPPSLPGNAAQRSFVLGGPCGIPSDARAVSTNATIWAPVTRGDMRVWAAGGGVPMTSMLNWEANILALANAGILQLGTGGAITVQIDGPGTVDLILDVNGYFQ